MTTPLHGQSICDLAPLLASGRIASAELTEACLGQIQQRQPELNAFITVLADSAREQAAAADAEIAARRYRGPLHGIPVSVKDLIDVRTTPTTAASRVRDGHLARDDAPVVARLRAAGAIVVGKCNLHEFAFGTTNEDSAYGPARNPHDRARSPGGSSGGSAAAIAAGMCIASVGTDTGGSIRIPAAACGIVGLKPAYGELPLDGIVPLARSLDHVGPMTRCVNDAWLLHRVMSGTTQPLPLVERDLEGTERLRVGVPGAELIEPLDPSVHRQFEWAIGRLATAGWRLDEVSIPHAADIPPIYLHIVFAEAAALHAATIESRPMDYTEPVRSRLQLARYVMAEDYVRALRGRQIVRAEVDAALETADVLMLPTLAIPAPVIGESRVRVGPATDSVRNVTLRLTQPFNLTGHPAISVPIGTTPDGLPVGLQIVGRRDDTDGLVKVALACERRLAWVST